MPRAYSTASGSTAAKASAHSRGTVVLTLMKRWPKRAVWYAPWRTWMPC